VIRALALIAVLGACGRVGFTTRDDSDPDASVDGAIDAPRCEAAEWTNNAVPLANLNVNGADDWDPAVSPDGLTIVYVTYRNGIEGELFVATRASIDDDFGTPALIPVFGSTTEDVFGPEWSIDGTKLYFTNMGPKVATYLGNGQFGPPADSKIPTSQFVFGSDNEDEVFGTEFFAIDDYDLSHYRLVGGMWVEQTLPPAYFRRGVGQNDGWPGFDRGRQEMYWEHDITGDSFLARARRSDADVALPASFDVLTTLGNDLSDPDVSRDGLRMYVGSRRRAGTDNDLYMFERACQ
jgi:hypothetical protein